MLLLEEAVSNGPQFFWLVPWIVLIPIIGLLFNILFGGRLPEKVVGWAASLASGLDGIENHIEPPEMFQGDIYAAQNLPHVPKTGTPMTEMPQLAEPTRILRRLGYSVANPAASARSRSEAFRMGWLM